MTALQLQAEIKRLLDQERNINVLEAIRMLLRREDPTVEDDFTEEELAELDKRRERHLRGEGTSYTLEESIARLRNLGK
ncbi:MAG: hypothetical protein J5I62_07850 [Flavobacteriales bacterium]|nr:hypothetical protein [Flavobacteriales bacterium]MEB2341083.1 hypothetical protein [Flavobacteriia bacterium]